MNWMNLLALTATCVFVMRAEPTCAGDVAPAYSSPIIIIATVMNVSEEPATNGNPPRVALKVNRVLRGDAKGSIRGLWNPPFHGIDTSGRDAELEAWKVIPMDKPKVGGKFILCGWMIDREDGPILSMSGHGKTPYSPVALRAAKKQIEYFDKARAKAKKARAAVSKAQK